MLFRSPGQSKLVIRIRFGVFWPKRAKNPKTDWDDNPGKPRLVIKFHSDEAQNCATPTPAPTKNGGVKNVPAVHYVLQNYRQLSKAVFQKLGMRRQSQSTFLFGRSWSQELEPELRLRLRPKMMHTKNHLVKKICSQNKICTFCQVGALGTGATGVLGAPEPEPSKCDDYATQQKM